MRQPVIRVSEVYFFPFVRPTVRNFDFKDSRIRQHETSHLPYLDLECATLLEMAGLDDVLIQSSAVVRTQKFLTFEDRTSNLFRNLISLKIKLRIWQFAYARPILAEIIIII